MTQTTIRAGTRRDQANWEFAVEFTMGVLRTARDWQEGQDAMANHPTIGPWLRETYGDGEVTQAQHIIREAEERLGEDLPY
jgi:hypothetical protein